MNLQFKWQWKFYFISDNLYIWSYLLFKIKKTVSNSFKWSIFYFPFQVRNKSIFLGNVNDVVGNIKSNTFKFCFSRLRQFQARPNICLHPITWLEKYMSVNANVFICTSLSWMPFCEIFTGKKKLPIWDKIYGLKCCEEFFQLLSSFNFLSW